VIRTKETGIEVRPGDHFEIASGGGGGWGDPATRSAAVRADDVESGFVSASGS
jgi:N-methylhydantoinase B